MRASLDPTRLATRLQQHSIIDRLRVEASEEHDAIQPHRDENVAGEAAANLRAPAASCNLRGVC